ncbi:YfbM family protein [Streptomyces sp. NPDC090445]|uniref:YfbM family protein n=1 Tax=Streptomyces sp. NPDC090445 TaxID=3365963 RepID=UPI0038225182
MSMIGEYVRLGPDDFERALREPEWAQEFVDALADAEFDAPPESSRARCHSTDKAWHALSFLLDRIGFPVDVVHGDAGIPGAEDWGYAPPRHLAPERVAAAAQAVAATPHTALVDGVTPQDLAAAEIYPVAVWERGEPLELEWVTVCYRDLAGFFRAAARDGDGMLMWIS